MDFEKLLAPIRDDAPTGDDLRRRTGDQILEVLEEHRRSVDVTDDPAGQGKDPDWRAVARYATDALTHQSKDLELAARLAEARAHLEGFPGLGDGLRFIKELMVRYWDVLHPGLDEGEVVLPIRARPLSWLSNALAVGGPGFLPGAKQVTLFEQGGRKYAWIDHENAERLDEASATSPERFQELAEQGMVTREQWSSALADTPNEMLRQTCEAISVCESETRELAELCTSRFGDEEGPNLGRLEDVLAEMRGYLQGRLREREGTGEPETEALEGAAESGAAAGSVGPAGSRQAALARLAEAAAYFRRAEPHSPVAALVERAIRWGHMSYEDLMRDYVKDESTLAQVWDVLGIPREDQG